jgi:hypothetical protein
MDRIRRIFYFQVRHEDTKEKALSFTLWLCPGFFFRVGGFVVKGFGTAQARPCLFS